MRLSILVALFFFVCLPVRSQKSCSALQAPPADPNIFITPSQEMEFGGFFGEQLQSQFKVIDDEKLIGYLSKVGDAVAAQLPNTGLRFQYFVYDRPEVQAFGLPGGRIYVSRKMVAFVKNEDELAGLLGHEMGHMVARQQALAVSRSLHDVLGLKTIPDGSDLFEVYNELVENLRLKKSHSGSSSNENRNQMVADQLGIQAVARAGYATQSFPDLLDRVMQTKGKTGSWLTDLFGSGNPNSARLREALKDASNLPAGCVASKVTKRTEEFTQWQEAALHYRGIGHAEKLEGVSARKTLNDPLRGDIRRFQYSQDGKYLLAQDDGGVYVISRDPLKTVFQIDAPDAEDAQFSPDSRSILFFSTSLQVETWDIERQEQSLVVDVPAIEGCRQTLLSPTGRFLACFQEDMRLVVFEVSSGDRIYEKEHFFDFDGGIGGSSGIFKFLYYLTHREIVTLRFSPDDRYFAASSRTHEAVLLDLEARRSLGISGDLRAAMAYSFAFLTANRVVGVNETDPRKSFVLEFPNGKVIDHVPLGGFQMEGTWNARYVLVRPLVDHPVGVYDLEKKEIVLAGRNPALSLWGDEVANERLGGEIGFYKVGELKPNKTLQLPQGKLGPLRSTAISPDMKWLAMSTSTRGGIWDIESNTRRAYVRGFMHASYTPIPAFFLDYPKFEKLDRELSIVSPVTLQAKSRPVDKDEDLRFFGDTLLQVKHNDKNGKANRNIEVNAMDTALMNPLWSRKFPKSAPGFGGTLGTGKLVLAWKANEDGLKEQVEGDPQLTAHWPKTRPNDADYFWEVIDVREGKTLGSVFLSTGKYSFVPEYWSAAGDWLAVADNHHRVLLYSISTGLVKTKWFGDRPVFSIGGDRLAIHKGQGHAVVYDLRTLKQTNEFYFANSISTNLFSADGNRFTVLTSDQTVFQLELKGLPPVTSTSN
jgi:WD40 repeat protein